jgi:mono/diheme cytochrome c family protein
MRNTYLFAAFIMILVSGLVYYACDTGSRDVQAAATPAELVARGAYLVNAMGCDDCHSPKIFGPNGPVPDPERRLSGHPADMPLGRIDKSALHDWVLFNAHNTAVVGPWGVSFAANLTSDQTGIGSWTEEQFIKAIREGKLKGLDGTRPLLPPMPWPSYAQLTDEDLKAVFAYLKTVKPIQNIPPQPIPPDQIK